MNIDIAATLIAVLTFFGIYALMAISLNLEYGVAGVPNFGQALFVSIGAYVTGVTYTRLLPILAGTDVINPCGTGLGQALQLRSDIMKSMPAVGFGNFLLTLLIAAIIGGLVGFFISYVTLRLKQEWYLALVLLVGGEIVRIVVRGMDDLICSHNGISGIAQPFAFIGEARTSAVLFMLLVLAIALIAYWYSEKLIRSPYGRLLKALRENENVTRSLGKRISVARAQIMLIGSVIAAISGVLFAVNLGFVNTNDFVVTLTLDVWVMVVLGGLGNMRGALVGALLITVMDRATAILAIQMNMSGITLEFNYVRFILFGVILLLMLRYRPQGILPEPTLTTTAHDVIQPSQTSKASDQ
ncbi:MAG: branched-chain amino acid ABC transporter permease [Anaerolineae bacterium]|nr:branched-chain amino acid ABC transporter permease [Anaerolineae bacterium]